MRTVLWKLLLTVLVAAAQGFPVLASAGDRPTGDRPTGIRPRFVRITMDQGLSNNSVYCLHQDRVGFLWFGTFAGLNRYDGTGFSVHKPGRSAWGDNVPGNLQGSVIFALEEDSEGRLWVGTDGGGLSVYNHALDTFETIRNKPGTGGLPADRIFSLAADPRGGLWIGTGGGGLAHREPVSGAISRIQPPPGLRFSSVRALQVLPDGMVLVGTEDAGLLGYQPATGTFAPIPLAGQPRGGGTVRTLAAGPDHRVWIGTASGAVEELTPGAAAATLALPAGPSAVRALSFDAMGRLWVGYESDGVTILEVSGKRPRIVVRDTSVGNVRALGRDRFGLQWIGLKDGGILSHDPRSERFSRFAMQSVRGLAETRSGDVLAGTDGSGLYRVRTGASAAVREVLPKGYERVYSVLEDRQGQLWVGTDGAGLLRRDPRGRFQSYRRKPSDPGSLSSDVVWALLEDRSGAIWIGTEGGGLDRWNAATETFDHFQHREDDPTSLLGSSVRTLRQAADGKLWIGTWDGGLSRLDPRTATFERFPELADTAVNALLEDSKGRLWVGTGSAGLALLKPDRTFAYTAKKDGLAGDTVTGVLEDANGSIWVATAERLSRFEPATGAIFHYGEEDGLADSECSQNAYLQGRDGLLWVGGPQGLTRFHPDVVRPDIRPPEIVFTKLEAYGAEGPYLVPLRAAKGETPVVDLDWRNTGIRFEAALLDFAAPVRNRYALQVEGLNKDWIPLGEQHGAIIPPLPPGTFTVRVKGADGNGIWSLADATFVIRVRPPFWRHPLGLTVGFLALAGAVGGAMVLRMRSLARKTEILRSYSRHIQEAREEERIAAARDVHDEIGQHLAALNLQAYWVHTHPEAPEPLRTERVGEMLGSISEAMSAVKSVATNLRPIALDALKFDEAVAWYARSFEHRSGIPVTVEISEGFPPVRGGLATALFRVLQEMLTNISRHSGAASATLKLAFAAGAITLECRDDGQGIAPGEAEADDAFGIIGMRERCAAFGGTLYVRGEAGAGTTFLARIPFQEAEEGKD
jgi:ligand-binding sensor domain-containing protein/signal transduction histidine kinase